MTFCEPIAPQKLTTQIFPELRFDAGGKLVCSIAPALSSSTGHKLSRRQRANFKAALYWLQGYQPPAQASNLDRVRGLLEAFHHLSQLSAWQAANDLLHIPVPPSQLEQADQPGRSLPLHEQLEVWGYYQELTDLYSTLLGKRDKVSDCVCCERLGAMHTYRGRLIEAKDFQQRALELADQLNDPIAKARAFLGLADIYIRLDQFELGIAQAQAALNLARQQDDQHLLADCLDIISSAYSDSYFPSYKPKLALRYIQEGLQLAQDVEDTTLQCRFLNRMGSIYSSMGKARTALKHHQGALALAEATGNVREQWANLHNLGVIHFLLLKNQEQGEALLLASLQVARRMQNLSCEAQSLGSRAVVLSSAKGSTQASQANLQHLIELTQQLGDPYLEWQTLLTLAPLLMRQKQFEQAKLYWDRAEALARSHRFRSVLFKVADLSNTSYLFSSLGDWRKGLRYGKKALAIARPLKNKQQQIFALLVIAYAYWQGNQRLWALLILLRYLPQAAQLALQNESTRYALLTGVQVIISSILTALQKLGSFFQVQPRNQKSR